MIRTMPWLRAAAVRLSVSICVVLSLAGCGTARQQAAAPAPSLVAVAVQAAECRDVPVNVELAARTEAAVSVEIRANVEGQLIDMSFQQGRMVRKGQLLFRIDPRRYAAAVELAGAAVERAEADFEMAREQQHLVNAQSALRQAEAGLLKANQDAERLKPLAQRRAIPQRDMDAAIAAQTSAVAAAEDARATVRTTTVGDRMGLRQAQANLTAAKAALARAQLDLEETDVKAPISGLIGRAEVSVGNYVGRGEPGRLATISQVDPINVVFGIPETLYLRINAKGVDRAALNRIELILAGDHPYPFLGRFANLGRTVDEKTGTLQVVAQFPNPKDLLLPGLSGRVRVGEETRHDAVLVPERALFDSQGAKAVYVVSADGKAALRGVVTDGSYQGKSIIAKGLGGGETVIVDGIAGVRPGQSVTTHAAKTGPDK